MKRNLVFLCLYLIMCHAAQAQHELMPKPYYYNFTGTEQYSLEGTKIVGLSSDSFYTMEYVKKFLNSNELSEKTSRIDIEWDQQPEAYEAYELKIFRDIINEYLFI